MPFTPTHTLAAVPIACLWSRPAVFSSLVIGSIVPDWPVYVPFGPDYALTHSFPGIILACLPLGLALALAYQALLKRPLFELLPASLRRRLSAHVDGPPLLNLRTLATIAAAVVAGAATHVVWDAFTHRGAWGVGLVPALQDVYVTVSGLDIPGYAVLQHGSTLIGFPVALLLFSIWYRKVTVGPLPAPGLSRMTRSLWIAILVGVPAVMVTTMLLDLTAPDLTVRRFFRILVGGVTRTGLAMMVLLACYGVFYHLVPGRGATIGVRS